MFYDPISPPGLPLSGEIVLHRMSARKEARRAEAQKRAREARLRKLVSLFDRDEIEDGVEALIAYLDARGGDPDREPDADDRGADDDGEAVNEDGADAIYPDLPRYGVDQTKGPINGREAEQTRMAGLYGLERSPTGGWRRRAA